MIEKPHNTELFRSWLHVPHAIAFEELSRLLTEQGKDILREAISPPTIYVPKGKS